MILSPDHKVPAATARLMFHVNNLIERPALQLAKGSAAAASSHSRFQAASVPSVSKADAPLMTFLGGKRSLEAVDFPRILEGASGRITTALWRLFATGGNSRSDWRRRCFWCLTGFIVAFCRACPVTEDNGEV